ncbi:Deleted in malignant brain tumors 1 protein [Holothuria leucospilota]|uniref:Deleted in malignant brain tumors 1 protein n=1 Tax=Holothuria leucospilota TaxID=206669 RepID=A0A9Q1GZD3_HOLLE|nr:Deleted in malignant brain tumors 1 protein [Holothuria leucospilota]
MRLGLSLLLSCLGFMVRLSSSSRIRLAGGNDTAGRVEVLLNGEWGTVCDDSWDIQDATVVCRQLGFPAAISSPSKAFFGRGQGLIHLDNVACKGHEKSILDCPRSKNLNCGHSEDAGVVCSLNALIEVRLAGGNDTSGRVEVFLDGQWGTVCDDSWGYNEAIVVCRQLGFPSALEATTNALFGEGHGKIHLNDVDCAGHEKSILQCPRSSNRKCVHAEDAGVVCSLNGKYLVRLANGNETAGRVEIFFNGLWGTVCDDSWDIQDATVVCRMLGFPSAIDATTNASFGKGQGLIHVTNLACNGNESSIMKCPQSTEHKCGHDKDAGAVCLAEFNFSAVRLADGNETAGRVEVFFNGRWGTVCDDSWDIQDAIVVCRQIGFLGALKATSNSFFGESQDDIQFDEVVCKGSEHSIFECRRSNVDPSCGIMEDAGVICSTGNFTVNNGNEIAGRVELYNNVRCGTVCDDNWGINDARVICRQQFGYNSTLSAPRKAAFGEGVRPIHFTSVRCPGHENSLMDCEYKRKSDCMHNEDANVTCSDVGYSKLKSIFKCFHSLGKCACNSFVPLLILTVPLKVAMN